MNARQLTPSKFFTAADFTGEITVTIKSIDFEDVEVEAKNGQPAKTERKGALWLVEHDKPWLCNVVNTKCIAAMFGDDDVEKRWPGKRLTLYIDRVMSFGQWVPGVRIKGSPDISQPVSVSLRLRKKREQTLTMQPTGAKSPQPSPPKPDKPRTPYDEMWKDFKASGLSDPAEFKTLVREAFNGKTKDFTSDDVLAFSAVLASRTAAPPSEPEAPPPF
jgi:hypothetical protein